MNRNRLLLVLLGLLAASSTYSFVQWSDVPETPTHTASVASQDNSRKTSAAERPKDRSPVKLHLLERSNDGTSVPKVDIFRGIQPPRPKPAKVARPPKPKVKPEPVNQPAPPRVIRQPLPRFRYLGRFEQKDRTLFFLEQGKEVFLAEKGRSFGERREFLLEKVEEEQLTVMIEGDDRPVLVRLENKFVKQPSRKPRRVLSVGSQDEQNKRSIPGLPEELQDLSDPEAIQEFVRNRALQLQEQSKP